MQQSHPKAPCLLRKLTIAIALALPVFGSPLSALAADSGTQNATSPNSATLNFNIPTLPLADALNKFIAASDWQVGFPAGLAKDVRSSAVSGNYTPQQALNKLLQGSGLIYRLTGSNSATLEKSPQSQTDFTTLKTMTVTANKYDDNGVDGLYLDSTSKVASKLGLSLRETPATVNIVSQEQMQQQGMRSVIEAYNSAPGVTAGNVPGEPGVTTMRGFSRAATGYMVDGMHITDSLLTSRNFDSWNFDRIEVLKGPSSVINGTGALAGSINMVTKQANHEKDSLQGLFSYGSFNALRGALGGNKIISDALAVRSDLVYSQTDGYINNTNSNTLGWTSGVSFKPTDRLSMSLDFDYFRDHYGTPYQGTPLIPGSAAKNASGIVSTSNGYVLDKAISNNNYDVANGVMESDNFWTKANVDYKLTDDWHLVNQFGYFYADRLWANSEDFVYNTTTKLLDRTTTNITHNQNIWSNRSYASFDGNIFQHHNRFVTGVEYVNTQLDSQRRFGTASSVDPFNPNVGSFPTPDTAANFSYRQNFNSGVSTWSGFMEDALNLTPAWIAVTGVRFENTELNRNIANLNANTTSNFGNTFNNVSWRLGSVYDIIPNTQVFGTYNHAVTPVTTLLLSSLTNANFKLSAGDAFEAGFKASFWDKRATWTTSFYHITQNDIITTSPTNPNLSVQGGSQLSRGIELDFAVKPTPQWRFGANAAFLDAHYTTLISGGINAAGHIPINVPEQTFNVSTFYTLPMAPITLGAIVRSTGGFYTDYANTIHVDGHTLLDLSLSYDIKKIGKLRLQGRNMTNEFYASWSGYTTSQVYIGAPRSVDLTWTKEF